MSSDLNYWLIDWFDWLCLVRGTYLPPWLMEVRRQLAEVVLFFPQIFRLGSKSLHRLNLFASPIKWFFFFSEDQENSDYNVNSQTKGAFDQVLWWFCSGFSSERVLEGWDEAIFVQASGSSVFCGWGFWIVFHGRGFRIVFRGQGFRIILSGRGFGIVFPGPVHFYFPLPFDVTDGTSVYWDTSECEHSSRYKYKQSPVSYVAMGRNVFSKPSG